MTGENILVIAFSVVVISLAIIYQKKEKKSFIGSLILWTYVVSSVSSIIYYFNPLYQPNYGITIGPYLYWISLFLIIMIPIFKYDKIESPKLNYNISLVNIVCSAGLFVSILPFIEYSSMLNMALASTDVAESFSDAYSEQETLRLSTLAVGFRLLVQFIYPFVLFGLIYMLKNGSINKLALIGALFTIITYNYEGVLRGTRNGLLTLILNLILIIVILIPYLDKDSRKRLVKSSLFVFVFLFAIFGFLSFARQSAIQEKSETFTMFYFINSYMGQGFLNFNDWLPHLKGHADGDYCFYLLKKITFQETHGLSIEYLKGYLSSHTGVPIATFYTFLGFFIIDIGPLWTFVYWLFISIFVYHLIKSSKIRLKMSTLFVVFIYSSMILNGTCLYYYSGIHGLRFIPVIFWYLFMRIQKM